MVTIVPSFTSNSKFNLLSTTSGKNVKVGPFKAGMPIDVPLWIAKTLKRRNFAEIETPEWLSVDVLTSILKEERESTLLSRRLPYHYFEIARALDCCLTDSSNNNASSSGSATGGGKATKVVLQDLVAVRSDKLRMHFHELSRSDLVHPPPGYDDVDDDGNYIDNSVDNKGQSSQAELPIISVTGICSYELNKVGPFLQRAFSDYGFLTRRSSSSTTTTSSSAASTTKSSSNDGVTATTTTAKKSKGLGGRLRRVSGAGGADGPNLDKENSANEDDTYGDDGGDDDDDDDHDDGSVVGKTTRRVSMARSRLRRFRS